MVMVSSGRETSTSASRHGNGRLMVMVSAEVVVVERSVDGCNA